MTKVKVAMNRNRVNNPSASSSRQVNGKGKAPVTAVTPPLLLGKRSHDQMVSSSKNYVSDDESDKDSEGSEEEVTSWISWFCSQQGNEFYCEVDIAYIKDDSNLFKLSSSVHYYAYALDVILDVESPNRYTFTDEQIQLIDASAEVLYGMIHARYILTNKGMDAMFTKYQNRDFGKCPRVYCNGQPCLPVGQNDLPEISPVKIYCPKCEDIYCPRSHMDGAYIGTTFPHMFLMTRAHLKPRKARKSYVPRVFGFKIHKP